VRNLQTDALPHGISFDCNAGEIIGIAGLAGAGRSELLQTMFGLAPLRGGCIQRRRGQGRTPVINPRQAVAMGIAFLGEDRQAMGLFRGQSVLTNMMIPGKVSGTATIGLIDRDMEAAAGKGFVDRLAVGCDNLHQAIEQLSGGNQQKTLIARWLHCDSDIFLLDEPTRGVDVRTKNAIYELLFGIRDRGKSIIMASSEIDELMTVCDRILVLSARKLVQTFLAGNWSEQDILHAAFSELTAGNKYAGASLTGEAQA
jgi:ribose transport system ATP-binding protein